MHDFLVSILPVSLFIITGIQLLFVILSISSYKKSREILFLLTALVAVGLTYDSLMLAVGGVISEESAGGAFKTLSQFRFVSHGALIPLLFLSGFLMFAFSALGPATGNFDLIFFISMFGEVCMILFFFLYAKKRSRA